MFACGCSEILDFVAWDAFDVVFMVLLDTELCLLCLDFMSGGGVDGFVGLRGVVYLLCLEFLC